MSIDDNVGTIRRFYEDVVSRCEFDLIAETHHPDYVSHGRKGSNVPLPDYLASLHQSFRDFTATPEDLIAADDKVVARVRLTGVHEGEFRGIAPTGRVVDVQEILIARFEDGRIVE